MSPSPLLFLLGSAVLNEGQHPLDASFHFLWSCVLPHQHQLVLILCRLGFLSCSLSLCVCHSLTFWCHGRKKQFSKSFSEKPKEAAAAQKLSCNASICAFHISTAVQNKTFSWSSSQLVLRTMSKNLPTDMQTGSKHLTCSEKVAQQLNNSGLSKISNHQARHQPARTRVGVFHNCAKENTIFQLVEISTR